MKDLEKEVKEEVLAEEKEILKELFEEIEEVVTAYLLGSVMCCGA